MKKTGLVEKLKTGNHMHYWQKCYTVKALWKTGPHPSKYATVLSYDPTFPFLCIYPKEPKAGTGRGIVIPPKCIIPPKRRVEKRQMPIKEGVKCHIHTIECHLTFRTNISLFNLHDVLINNNKAARGKQIGTAGELLLDRYRIN